MQYFIYLNKRKKEVKHYGLVVGHKNVGTKPLYILLGWPTLTICPYFPLKRYKAAEKEKEQHNYTGSCSE